MTVRILRVLAVLAVLCAVGLPAHATPVPAQAAPAHDAQAAPPSSVAPVLTPASVTVTITDISPAVWTPGTELMVTATLTNTTSEEISGALAALRTTRYPITVRSYLWQWANPDPTVPGVVGQVQSTMPLDPPLAPGESRSVTLSLGGDALADDADLWGPHGLAMEVRADTGARIGLDRTFAAWAPTASFAPTSVSLVVPFVASPGFLTEPEGALVTAQSAAPGTTSTSTGPTRQLARAPTRLDVVSGVITGAAATVAVDPALLANSTYATLVRTLAATNDTFPLPFGDLDVAAAAHASQPELLSDAITVGRDQWRTVVGSLAGPDVLFPAFGVQDSIVLDALTTAFPGSAILAAPDEFALSDSITYTPSGLITEGRTPVLTPDQVLSALFTAPTESSPATSAQRIIAELMVITAERPADGRHVVITVPRTWAPNPAYATAQVAALSGTPWIHPAALTELVSSSASGTPHASEPSEHIGDGELAPSTIADLLTAREQTAAIAVALPPGSPLLAEFDEDMRAALSALARSSEARDGEIERLLNLAGDISSHITTISGSAITQLSAEAELPVIVANSLAVPVTVTVHLQPQGNSFRVVSDPEVTVPPGGEVTVRVPVVAQVNGPNKVQVLLMNSVGDIIGTGEQLSVQVRAEWETVFTILAGGAMVVILVLGLYRTIRGHRGTRADQMAAEGIEPEPE